MICLFADLSLFSLFAFTRGTRRRLLHYTFDSHRISLRGLSARRFLHECSSVFAIPYRDCNSNPIAAVFSPQRCQALVTRIA
jgi:hypothetical protein